MGFLSRAHPLANYMVLANPQDLGEAVVGGVTPTERLLGPSSWLQLSSSSPPPRTRDPHNTHTVYHTYHSRRLGGWRELAPQPVGSQR